MRVKKYPSPNTYANTWPDSASVPVGVTTEEMTGAEFSAWLAAQPAFEVLTGPGEIELWRLRCICERRGLDSAINAGIAALPALAQQVARHQWERKPTIQRDEWLTRKIRVWIGYTAKQMDNMFIAANELGGE